MEITRWEPLRDMRRFFDEIDSGINRINWELAVDLYEEGDEVIAELNVPGIDPSKIEISAEDGQLEIKGDRDQKEEKKGKNYYSREIRRGSFSRRIQLPSSVNAESASATYRNGVLRIRFSKEKNASTRKKIDVNVE